jgi:hypothetical protein
MDPVCSREDGPSECGPSWVGVTRNNQTKFLLRTVKGIVPKGTRAAAVAIQFDRVDGAYDDGYADSLSLVLTCV